MGLKTRLSELEGNSELTVVEEPYNALKLEAKENKYCSMYVPRPLKNYVALDKNREFGVCCVVKS